LHLSGSMLTPVYAPECGRVRSEVAKEYAEIL
jgi:hypothetical protein